MQPNGANNLLDQLQVWLIFLQRPAVQLQIITLIVAIAVAWQLTVLLRRLIRAVAKRRTRGRPEVRNHLLNRILPALAQFYFPVISLVLIWYIIRIFREQALLTGLLASTLVLFWTLLIYDVLLIVLYAAFSEKNVRPYHNRLLNPLFVVFGLGFVVANFFDVRIIGDTTLVTLFGNTVSVNAVALSLFSLFVFINFSWILLRVLREVVLPRLGADRGTTHSVITITRYALIFAGVFLGLGSLGFDLTTLAFIGGGLSVGIGFGLQNIVANFLSGILLLFEQSLRPGDVVEVNGEVGIVEKLSIRSTTVRTYNNVEVIIPNENFLTSAVVTNTNTNRLVRSLLSVGAGYDSDPKQVRDVLISVAERHGLVVKDPTPSVFFVGFGDSSIDFELAIWVDQPRMLPKVRSDLYFMIWDAFEKYDIEIPFPQRDLNLRRGFPEFVNPNGTPDAAPLPDADAEQAEPLPKPDKPNLPG